MGHWDNGSPHGNGTYLALNGDKYIGGFRRGLIVGPGTIYEVNGNIRFVQVVLGENWHPYIQRPVICNKP